MELRGYLAFGHAQAHLQPFPFCMDVKPVVCLPAPDPRLLPSRKELHTTVGLPTLMGYLLPLDAPLHVLPGVAGACLWPFSSRMDV